MLNPGITEFVKLLNEEGFVTTDSGDGETHDFVDCDREQGYVVILVDPRDLIDEADRLALLLATYGLELGNLTMDPDDGVVNGDYYMQAMYTPGDDVGIIDLSYIHDRQLVPTVLN